MHINELATESMPSPAAVPSIIERPSTDGAPASEMRPTEKPMILAAGKKTNINTSLQRVTIRKPSAIGRRKLSVDANSRNYTTDRLPGGEVSQSRPESRVNLILAQS